MVDARVAERLVALETADVVVPPPPGLAKRPPLYFRVLAEPNAFLRVELWELGRPYGARTVSSTGSQSLEARRIALAAAELARQLRERRMLELAALRREKGAERTEERASRGVPIYGRMAWAGGVRAATIGFSDAWLVGPHLDAALRLSAGPRLTLGGAWLAGSADPSGPGRDLRFLEVTLGLSHAVSLGSQVGLDLGFQVAAASVRVAGATASATPMDTWSARGSAFARVEARVSSALTVVLGPDIGALLRPVALPGAEGAGKLSGLWLGGALSAVVDPVQRYKNQ